VSSGNMENVLDYYIRMLTNINLDTGQIFGIGIIHSWVATVTMIYLFILAALIYRARPKAPENRFMSLLLITEGYKMNTSFYMLYPFGPDILPLSQYNRVVWFFFALLSLLLYISVVSFYPVKGLTFMRKDVIRKNLYWALPVLSGIIISFLLVKNGGIVNTFGGATYVFNSVAGGVADVHLYPGTKDIGTAYVLNLPDYVPYYFIVPEQTGLARFFLFGQVLFALIAVFLTRSAKKTLEENPETDEKAKEARALSIGFLGKAVFFGSMVFFMIFITVKFGQFNLLDVATMGTNVPLLILYVIGMYGFLFSMVFASLFEGLMFTYAILKNEILGIDERLRKTFTTAVFASIGAILVLVASELIETFIEFGWVGGIIIGVPMIVLRKPIFALIHKISNRIMPDSFTTKEKMYLDAYALAMEDGTITERERQLLDMQAKTLELDGSRVKYLEKKHDLENQEISTSPKIPENVAEAMANKIKSEAEQHRKRNIPDE